MRQAVREREAGDQDAVLCIDDDIKGPLGSLADIHGEHSPLPEGEVRQTRDG